MQISFESLHDFVLVLCFHLVLTKTIKNTIPPMNVYTYEGRLYLHMNKMIHILNCRSIK